MAKLKIGVVGCGIMGVRHLAVAAASPLAEAFAVADTLPDRARAAAEKYGAKRVFSDGRELIADPDVQAVVFSTPTGRRDELVIAALERGKHVLAEKPIAMNAETVRRMIRARGDRVAACCSSRFHAFESARVAARFVSTGALGDIRVVHCRVHDPAGPPPKSPPPTWRLSRRENGGGILVNWGCYDLDYLLGVCNWSLRPRTVFAQTWQVPPRLRANVAPDSDAETHVAALILCDGGAVISYERGEYMPAHGQQAWQVIGTHGSLNLNMLYQEGKVMTHDEVTAEAGLVTREIWRGTETWEQMQDYVLTDFIQAVVEGRPPHTTLEKALVLQQITDAVYASAATGMAVPIP
ncbi:MAG TPA: Gfo/Idh/MocA family oxidoreductase [Spirochaetia bacterium]|nr:Gfo/Idh/MocA family oxidoreductase [Spirochaetia bacterium]